MPTILSPIAPEVMNPFHNGFVVAGCILFSIAVLLLIGAFLERWNPFLEAAQSIILSQLVIYLGCILLLIGGVTMHFAEKDNTEQYQTQMSEWIETESDIPLEPEFVEKLIDGETVTVDVADLIVVLVLEDTPDGRVELIKNQQVSFNSPNQYLDLE